MAQKKGDIKKRENKRGSKERSTGEIFLFGDDSGIGQMPEVEKHVQKCKVSAGGEQRRGESPKGGDLPVAPKG